MRAHEYNELTRKRRGFADWVIPAEFCHNGNFDVEYMMETLKEKHLVGYDIYGRMVLTEQLEEEFPGVAEMLASIFRDDEQARMDSMANRGEVHQTINEDGKTVYFFDDGSQLMNGWGPMW